MNRDSLINELSGGKGYAFLTSEQRNQVNNPVVSVPKPSVSEMGIASTQDATRILREKQATENRLTPPPQPAPTQATGASTTPTISTQQPQASTGKVTLINPATGQSISYDDASINRENIQQNLTAGYQLESASGAVPSWLTTTSQGTQVAPKTPEQIQKEKDEAVVQKYTDILGNIEKSVANDPALIGMLQNISAQFEQRVKEQEQINKSRNAAISTAGVRLGSRYAGGSAGPMQGIISAQEQAGIDKIAEINTQKTTALIEAKNAFISKKWNEYAKLVDLAEKRLAESTKAVVELNKTMATEDQKRKEAARLGSIGTAVADLMRKGITDPRDLMDYINTYEDGTPTGANLNAEELKKMTDLFGLDVDKGIGDILKNAGKNGAPANVIDAISSAKNLGEAVKAAGTYLKDVPSTSGIVAEYEYYKKQQEEMGKPALSFDAYQNVDANRKARIQQAAGAANLNASLRSAALQLSDDYESRSKDFYTSRDAYNRILASASDPSAAGDLALIFSYMKVLDPGSTVREGEFANAQNAGGAWDKVGALYNKVANGQRLTESQRKDFTNRATKLFESQKKTQEGTVKTFTERATQYGVPVDLVVRNIEPNPGATSATEIAEKSEQEAQSILSSYVQKNPGKAKQIDASVKAMEKSLGRSITSIEFLQAFPEYSK